MWPYSFWRSLVRNDRHAELNVTTTTEINASILMYNIILSAAAASTHCILQLCKQLRGANIDYWWIKWILMTCICYGEIRRWVFLRVSLNLSDEPLHRIFCPVEGQWHCWCWRTFPSPSLFIRLAASHVSYIFNIFWTLLWNWITSAGWQWISIRFC